MKKQLKKLLNRLLNWSIVWALVEATLGRASNIYRLIKGLKVWDEKAYSEYNTRLYNDTLAVKILDGRVRQLFSSLAVLTGPFKGMQYPRFNAFGSALYSKLLGSYEMELHNVFNQALTVNYNRYWLRRGILCRRCRDEDKMYHSLCF